MVHLGLHFPKGNACVRCRTGLRRIVSVETEEQNVDLSSLCQGCFTQHHLVT